MDFYSCEVRIGGDMNNTVPRKMVSASEIVMLRKTHGNDAVVNIEYEDSKNVDDVDLYTDIEKRFFCRENQANGKIFYATFGEPESPRLIPSLKVNTLERIRKDVEESIPSMDKTFEQAKEELIRRGGKFKKEDTLEDINRKIAELKALEG